MTFDAARWQANAEYEKTRNVQLRKSMRIPYEVKAFLMELISLHGKRSEYFATCITCTHFKENVCDLVNITPPPQVIADGCPKYDDIDEIPF